MEQTVVFVERKGDDFIETPSPWASQDDEWKDRPRGQRGEEKSTYAERDKGEWPSWLADIIENKENLPSPDVPPNLNI